MTLTVPGLIVLIVIAAICGAVGKALAGGAPGERPLHALAAERAHLRPAGRVVQQLGHQGRELALVVGGGVERRVARRHPRLAQVERHDRPAAA